MIVESIISARSIWFMEMRALNPRGRNLFPHITPLLNRLYGFTTPTEFDESKGVEYKKGEFSPSGSGRDLTGVNLTVFNDGVVAQTCTTTDDTDTFLSTGLEQLAKEGIITYRPEMIRRKWYATEWVVRPQTPLKTPAPFTKLLSLLKESVYPNSSSHQYELTSMFFDVDFTAPNRQVHFTFQRRSSLPFEENLFYSHGPFTTAQHTRILEELERALSA